MADITLPELTEAKITGTGVFDVLMRATKAHLDAEFTSNRIKGTEYATVYLGSLESVLRASLDFVLQNRKATLEAELLEKQIALVAQQGLNAVTENLVLQAQKCKLDAEFDLLVGQKDRNATEITLLTQKILTERAQTSSTGVDADSVVGRQKALYAAQTSGFTRDAEQKAAKILADTWNVRRTTDDGTSANDTNMLSDVVVGRAITKLLSGVGA